MHKKVLNLIVLSNGQSCSGTNSDWGKIWVYLIHREGLYFEQLGFSIGGRHCGVALLFNSGLI